MAASITETAAEAVQGLPFSSENVHALSRTPSLTVEGARFLVGFGDAFELNAGGEGCRGARFYAFGRWGPGFNRTLRTAGKYAFKCHAPTFEAYSS